MVLCLPESPGNHSPGSDDRRRGGVAPRPYPVEDGERVPGVGVGEGQDPEQLAESGLLEFEKPAAREEMEATQDRTRAIHRGQAFLQSPVDHSLSTHLSHSSYTGRNVKTSAKKEKLAPRT